jgi:hypothetical protein
MTRQIALVLIAAGLVLGTLPTAQAKQYNQRPFPDSGGNSKIMSTIAKAKAARGQDIGSDDDGGTPPCGVERDGVIVDRRADGQSVIVLTRDVVATGGADVNIGRDCNR